MPLGSGARQSPDRRGIEISRRASGHQAVDRYSGLQVQISSDSMLWQVWNPGCLEAEQNKLDVRLASVHTRTRNFVDRLKAQYDSEAEEWIGIGK